ncbi:hypothetical protein NSND_50147 [Nitrospira sp. ND1]|nr:hypothetical protein NSND_50147 [Nitrospira sp. ND1]
MCGFKSRLPHQNANAFPPRPAPFAFLQVLPNLASVKTPPVGSTFGLIAERRYMLSLSLSLSCAWFISAGKWWAPALSGF